MLILVDPTHHISIDVSEVKTARYDARPGREAVVIEWMSGSVTYFEHSPTMHAGDAYQRIAEELSMAAK